MFALISPNEKQGQYQRIAELAPVPFDVAEPLHWIAAPAGTTTDGHAYDPVANAIVAYAPNMTAHDVWMQIKAHRDTVKAAGVKVGEHWFHSDSDSRIQQIGLVMMGANIPANMQWKTMSGVFVAMTPTLAEQIFAATAAHDQAAFAVSEQHRIAMEASADPAAYDYSAGWPAVYGVQP